MSRETGVLLAVNIDTDILGVLLIKVNEPYATQ